MKIIERIVLSIQYISHYYFYIQYLQIRNRSISIHFFALWRNTCDFQTLQYTIAKVLKNK